MDPAEEQQQEIEVLKSIYPDEFRRISESAFSVSIKLDTESDRTHTLALQIHYVDQYPEVVPQISVDIATNEDYGKCNSNEECYESEIEAVESDDDDEDTREAKRALHMSEQVEFEKSHLQELERLLYAEAEMQLGVPMVFALVSLLKEEAEVKFAQILDHMNAEYEKRSSEREQKEQQKFIGTKVTRDLYFEWRRMFRLEMKIQETENEKQLAMHDGKLSGRQIFEQGLSGEDDVIEGVKKIELQV